MALVTILPKPTVNKSETSYSQTAKWVDSDKIRFRDGRPEKIGGWDKTDAAAFTGICRALHPWVDISSRKIVALGTHLKLQAYLGSGFLDLTPERDSGALSNPFTTTNTSDSVQVDHVEHGLFVGDYARYPSVGATVGGLTMTGEWVVATVIDGDSYTFTHTSSATSTEGPAGGSTDYEYDIHVGPVDTTVKQGYGLDAYDTGTYGTIRTNSVVDPARTWMLDNWGERLIACPRGGDIYEWDPNGSARAQIVENAPINNAGAFVTPEKFLVALGAGGNPFQVDWSDQDANTVWTPSATNLAGSWTLNAKTPIVSAIIARARMNLIFTDIECFEMQFTGDDNVYRISRVSDGSGILGPKAAAVYNDTVYWAGDGDFFMYDGFVRNMDSADARDFVFDNLNTAQKEKVHAGVCNEFGEIWWFYPAGSATEIDSYVMANVRDGGWSFGSLVRTAWADRGVFTNPLATDASSFLFNHESGVDDESAAMDAFIETAPLELGDGNLLHDINAIYVDLDDQVGGVSFTLRTRDHPRDTLVVEGPYVARPTDGVLDDVRAGGRQVAMRVGSNVVGGFFRYGKVRLDIEPAGARR